MILYLPGVIDQQWMRFNASEGKDIIRTKHKRVSMRKFTGCQM